MSEMRVDVAPRISRDGAVEILRGSPMGEYAGEIFDYAAHAGIDPAYILAIARKETSLGRDGVGRAPQCNAWALRDHGWGRGYDGAGGFSYYKSYLDAAHDVIDLLTDTGSRAGRRLYFQDGLRTVESITHRYAPPVENATATYIRQVREAIAAWTLAYPPESDDPEPDDPPEDDDGLEALLDWMGERITEFAQFRDRIEGADIVSRLAALEAIVARVAPTVTPVSFGPSTTTPAAGPYEPIGGGPSQ